MSRYFLHCYTPVYKYLPWCNLFEPTKIWTPPVYICYQIWIFHSKSPNRYRSLGVEIHWQIFTSFANLDPPVKLNWRMINWVYFYLVSSWMDGNLQLISLKEKTTRWKPNTCLERKVKVPLGGISWFYKKFLDTIYWLEDGQFKMSSSEQKVRSYQPSVNCRNKANNNNAVQQVTSHWKSRLTNNTWL